MHVLSPESYLLSIFLFRARTGVKPVRRQRYPWPAFIPIETKSRSLAYPLRFVFNSVCCSPVGNDELLVTHVRLDYGYADSADSIYKGRQDASRAAGVRTRHRPRRRAIDL